MSAVVTVTELTKRYRGVTALDGVSFSLAEHRIHGLLGRNGAGKTTLMQILTAQNFATSGEVSVFGQHPYENEQVLSRISFIKESQTYPSHLRVTHVLRAARLVYPGWDEELAQRLVDVFQLPRGRNVRKLSRGMLSALGIVVGSPHAPHSPSSTSPTWAWTPWPGNSSTTTCWPTTPNIPAPSCCRPISSTRSAT